MFLNEFIPVKDILIYSDFISLIQKYEHVKFKFLYIFSKVLLLITIICHYIKIAEHIAFHKTHSKT